MDPNSSHQVIVPQKFVFPNFKDWKWLNGVELGSVIFIPNIPFGIFENSKSMRLWFESFLCLHSIESNGVKISMTKCIKFVHLTHPKNQILTIKNASFPNYQSGFLIVQSNYQASIILPLLKNSPFPNTNIFPAANLAEIFGINISEVRKSIRPHDQAIDIPPSYAQPKISETVPDRTKKSPTKKEKRKVARLVVGNQLMSLESPLRTGVGGLSAEVWAGDEEFAVKKL
jgi:hypothetical protein